MKTPTQLDREIQIATGEAWRPSPGAWARSEDWAHAMANDQTLVDLTDELGVSLPRGGRTKIQRTTISLSEKFNRYRAADDEGISELRRLLSNPKTARSIPPPVIWRVNQQLRLLDGAHRIDAAEAVGFRCVPALVFEVVPR